MKKICLVVRDKYQNEALTRLREIGVMHLERRNASSDALAKALERKNRAENAMGLIQAYKTPGKKKPPARQTSQRDRRTAPGGRRGRRATDLMGTEELEPYSLDAVNAPERPDLVDLMVGMGRDRKALEDRITFLARERARVEVWGEFEPARIKELAASGISLFLYVLTPDAFSALPEDTRYIKMGEDKNAVYLVVLDREIPGMPAFSLPEKSISRIDYELKELKYKLGELDLRIKSFADRRPVLNKEMAGMQSNIDFEAARVELTKVEDVPAELGVSYLTGYVPADDMGRLKQAASENGWALTADDPAPEDEVPTKLKNNKIVQLLYPLTDFLEVVPGYHETDISGWFLLFFCIFFGMIFGDAGYGTLLFIIALFGVIRTAKNGVPGVLKMLLLLSAANILWGVLTCTWFGIEIAKLPRFLKDISLSYISPAKTDQAVVDQNLQIFCFSLALLQLTIAHIKGIARTIKSPRVFAEIGSLAMLWGMYNVVLFLVVSNSNRRFPLQPVSIGLLAGGFALTFVFASYEGSVGRSILISCKNIISVVLGITNVFSDIMSYIRLWAVGLAGASIAATVNSMVGPMLGNFLVFVGVILLVFGHGLNIVLNVLSVLVHGVRLNTLEFSGHIGLTWAGTAYRPFAETVKK
ncbi:MAG: V-type ATP synthase subunit I [Treponema sp.]|jgi:V/A-type H+-transporting ATPase subunit I|nr:V-type ATP synthase subunit I [Treponema sp.]